MTTPEITAEEQYFLELTNRARLDPLGEAQRYGIDINDDLAPGTLSGDAMQVLAPNEFLNDAANFHSHWMLDTDQFQHAGSGGSSAGDRMEDAGYTFTGAWSWAENLAWQGTTGTINLASAIEAHHQGLFLSSGHRENTLNPYLREVGIAQVRGTFTVSGTNYDSSMLTANFATSGTNVYLTGVAYNDTNGNDFYDIGEGQSDVQFILENGDDVVNGNAGGYALGIAANAGYTDVEIRFGSNSNLIAVDFGNQNVKLDRIGNTTLATDGSVDLISGTITDINVLGENDVTLRGTNADNIFTGSRGDEIMRGYDGHDILLGNNGNDELYGGSGNDLLRGGNGVDLLVGGNNRDTLYGGNGYDVIYGDNGEDTVWGDDGNDIIYGGSQADRLHGNNGNDEITGGTGNDQIFGGNGNDLIYAQGDNDFVRSHNGNDTIYGGSGHDRLEGNAGDDIAYGGHGNDEIDGHIGRDTLYGGSGNDTIDGGHWRDYLYGGNGTDALYGGQSSDFMWGDNGNDTLYGGTQNDRLHGNDNNDLLFGDSGKDQLFGGNGEDELYGGSGNDRLDGSRDDDILTGGTGADRFVFKVNQGNDIVTDFSDIENDTLLLDEDMFNPGITKDNVLEDYTEILNGNTVITTDSGQTITLLGITTITDTDFDFF